MGFAGCRVEVLGSYLGDDGLRLSDIPDLEIKEGEVRFRNQDPSQPSICTYVVIREL
jgi:hypothetical protein